ncbi:hypothetical protein LLG88_13580 [bacterium]|nr:hypothetical protein [bacterium]
MTYQITITSCDPPAATVTCIHDDGTREEPRPITVSFRPAANGACSLFNVHGPLSVQAGDRVTVKYPEPYRSAFELPVATLVD